MACITTMQRYEIKYLLGAREKEAVLQAMSPYMELDEYGRTTIRNVYFDTDSFRLIRRCWKNQPIRKNCESGAISRPVRMIRCLWS